MESELETIRKLPKTSKSPNKTHDTEARAQILCQAPKRSSKIHVTFLCATQSTTTKPGSRTNDQTGGQQAATVAVSLEAEVQE